MVLATPKELVIPLRLHTETMPTQDLPDSGTYIVPIGDNLQKELVQFFEGLRPQDFKVAKDDQNVRVVDHSILATRDVRSLMDEIGLSHKVETAPAWVLI